MLILFAGFSPFLGGLSTTLVAPFCTVAVVVILVIALVASPDGAVLKPAGTMTGSSLDSRRSGLKNPI
jgi:hypothetical protein